MLIKPFNTKANSGFTLIEMAIVLVIVGLVVSGIVLGRSVIRQSEINSAISDEQKYAQAALNFQQKYGALPGDFATATSYWTASTTGCTTYPTTAAVTCNGDGNGQIGITYGSSTPAEAEEVLFWQHLDLAQMIPGSYTASSGAGTGTYAADHVIGQNCPASKVDGAGFGVVWIGIVASGGGTTYPASTYPTDNGNSLGHVFIFGGYSKNNFPVAPVLTTAEASGIDSKFDDGNPATGNIETWLTTAGAGYPATCLSNSTTYASTATTGDLCSLIFLTGF